jgi:tRNA nucleotidyltransferase (CCA-adding enzyme)
MQIYLVGGAVRDQYLLLPVTERDWVVVGATPEIMLNLGYQPVGKDFPVFLHPKTHEEYALARTERKTGHGYAGFSFNAHEKVTLEADLLRRDITINAMAQDNSGRLIDPYGGQRDLQDRYLRHVSLAFTEDPVRVLRIARFAARFAPLQFRIAPETFALMVSMVKAGEVRYLVAERVWQEIQKALLTQKPSEFFNVLHSCGADAIIFPEIEYLPYLSIIDQVSPENPGIRFAILTACLVNEGTSYLKAQKTISLVNQLQRRLKIQKQYIQLAELVARWHYLFLRVPRLSPVSLLIFLQRCDALRRPERFSEFLMACASILGHQRVDVIRSSQYLERMLAALRQLDTRDLQQQGLVGPAFAAGLRNQQLTLINDLQALLLADFTKEDLKIEEK